MHLISKNTIDFSCNSTQFGKAVQNQLGFLLEKDLYPKLENLLNLYEEKNEVWKIDFLNIDLGKIEKKNWKEVLVNNVLLQIEAYLKVNRSHGNLKKKEQSDVWISKEISQVDAVFKVQKHATNLFIKFLKTGCLEANSISNTLEEIVKIIIIDEEFAEKLTNCFLEDTHCILRFTFSSPLIFKVSVFNYFSIKISNPILKIIQNKHGQDEPIQSFLQKIEDAEQQKFWLEFLEWMIFLQATQNASPVHIYHFITLSKTYWSILEIELSAFLKYSLEEKNYWDERQVDFFKACVLKIDAKVDESDEVETVQDTRIKKEEITVEFYVENAGLVLLHPFLQKLFEKLNFCENDIWLDDFSVQKAILLSQYLMTGIEEVEESELLLNKILCGVDINKVVNTKLKISDVEKELGEQLLQAVLQHWTPMSNSSTGALQKNFSSKKRQIGRKQRKSF